MRFDMEDVGYGWLFGLWVSYDTKLKEFYIGFGFMSKIGMITIGGKK